MPVIQNLPGMKGCIKEWKRGEYIISTDPARLSLDAIQGFLKSSYWASERKSDVIVRSLENSLNFGIFKGETQVGFARVVSDFATMFWLADVFIQEEQRGQGLGKWLVACVMDHPDLQGLLGILATRDAHGLYARYGFVCPEESSRLMWTRK